MMWRSDVDIQMARRVAAWDRLRGVGLDEGEDKGPERGGGVYVRRRGLT